MVDDWELEGEWDELDDKSSGKPSTKIPTVVDDVVYDDGKEITPANLNIALVGYEHSGKSIMYTLSGYWNQSWWTTSTAKTGVLIENYPKCKHMIKNGVLPEVELIQVLDLDCSYGTLSRTGIFGKLARPLYKKGIIKRTKNLNIPQRQAGLVNKVFKEIAIQDFDICKQKIDNEINKAVKNNPETTVLAVDSMTSLDELLNNKFRILYEVAIAPTRKDKKGKVKDYYGASLDGIKQSYWKIRNGWWLSTLRTKRQYQGWQFDTYKVETKHPIWLARELKEAEDAGKDVSKVKDYKIEWAPKTKYDLDIILWLENNGLRGDNADYWARIKNRFEGSSLLDDEFHREVHYTPRRVCAFYDLMEQLAPSILGEVEREDGTYEDDDIFGQSVIFK